MKNNADNFMKNANGTLPGVINDFFTGGSDTQPVKNEIITANATTGAATASTTTPCGCKGDNHKKVISFVLGGLIGGTIAYFAFKNK